MHSSLYAIGSILLAWAPATAACPTRPRTAAGVLETEKAWVAALEGRDEAALACTLDDKFSDNNWRGAEVSRAEVLAHLPQRPNSKLHLAELKTDVEGTLAVVRGLNTQTGADGKVAGSVRFTDVFIYRDGRWQAFRAQETLVQAKPQ